MFYNFALFTLAFESAHLIFAVKYWSLSQRLMQIINKEVVTAWQKLKIPLAFWSILFLIVASCTCMISLGNLEVTKYHFFGTLTQTGSKSPAQKFQTIMV